MTSKKTVVDGVPIELDKTRHLRYTGYSFLRVERATGKPMTQLDQSFTSMITQVWAGLLEEDDTLTVEDVARMVEGHNLSALGTAIQEAMKRGGWTDESNGASDPLDTGSNGGQSADTT